MQFAVSQEFGPPVAKAALVTEPEADRGPHAGSARGVVVATGRTTQLSEPEAVATGLMHNCQNRSGRNEMVKFNSRLWPVATASGSDS